ncbi:hypothetical protein A2U01_0057539, partial [Trifolium medium]|nr:hypothetical protein [Trifolium medium]
SVSGLVGYTLKHEALVEVTRLSEGYKLEY